MTTTTEVITLPSNFAYVIIGLTVLFISTRIIKAGPAHIFALLLGGVIITHIQQKSATEVMSFNAEMDYRNGLLGSPSHFYLDSNLINLFYSIFTWRQLNEKNFDNAVEAANNVLHLREDTENQLERCVDNYEIAYEQSKLCMNYVHTFVYAVQQPLLIKKLKAVLARLQQLLERNLVAIQRNCENLELAKPKRDINSRFIEDALGPKPYDPYVSETAFDVFQ